MANTINPNEIIPTPANGLLKDLTWGVKKIVDADAAGGGSSDFSTAEVTFTGSTTLATMIGAFVVDTEDFAGTSFEASAGVDMPAVTLILYNGKAELEFTQAHGIVFSSINATGNAQEIETNIYEVSGDCNFEILS